MKFCILKVLTAVTCILIGCLVATAKPPQSVIPVTPRSVIAVEPACTACDCLLGKPCDCEDCPAGIEANYASLKSKALKAGKPFIVFIGQPSWRMEGCVTVRRDDYPSDLKRGVVVGMPRNGDLLEHAVLHGWANADKIRASFATAAVVPQVPQIEHRWQPQVQYYQPFFQPQMFMSGGNCSGGR